MNGAVFNLLRDMSTIIEFDGFKKMKAFENPPGKMKLLRVEEQVLRNSLSLKSRLFSCERTLASLDGFVEHNPNRTGACFLKEFFIIREKQKIEAKLEDAIPEVVKEFDMPNNHSSANFGNKKFREIEKKLNDYVQNFPDYSVTHLDLFKFCTQESKGGFKEAAKLCWDLLYDARTRFGFSRKLIDMRGDRSKNGDNIGDTYHFFAMMAWSIQSDVPSFFYYPGVIGLQLLGGNGSFDSKEFKSDIAGKRAGTFVKEKFDNLKENPNLLKEVNCSTDYLMNFFNFDTNFK